MQAGGEDYELKQMRDMAAAKKRWDSLVFQIILWKYLVSPLLTIINAGLLIFCSFRFNFSWVLGFQMLIILILHNILISHVYWTWKRRHCLIYFLIMCLKILIWLFHCILCIDQGRKSKSSYTKGIWVCYSTFWQNLTWRSAIYWAQKGEMFFLHPRLNLIH